MRPSIPGQLLNASKRKPTLMAAPDSLLNSYLLQLSLTIFRVVTRRSPYSSLLDAFSTSPSLLSLPSSAS